ncbi:MAG: segregation/condensation protein A [Oscillospiraceae bacterium]|jgi:segregation and condensation protein A|nr:segregation/condensation protein A [Oscillospiraceae bacterium]
MELPTFRLAEINFEGPLTLILQLLARARLEIRDVKIATIVEQYNAHMSELERMNLEVAGEFVAMAAHLTYLKARSLIEEEEAQSEIELLLQSLETLKMREGFGSIREAAQLFGKTMTFESHTKPPEPLDFGTAYDYAIDLTDLYHAYRAIETQLKEPDTRSERVRNAMPASVEFELSRKAEQILVFAGSVASFRLADVLEVCRTNSELVAAFLAVLELIREGKLTIDANLEIMLSLGELTAALSAE